MQKCSRCGFKSVSVRRVVDEEGNDIGSQTLCTNCNNVLRDDVDQLAQGEQ